MNIYLSNHSIVVNLHQSAKQFKRYLIYLIICTQSDLIATFLPRRKTALDFVFFFFVSFYRIDLNRKQLYFFFLSEPTTEILGGPELFIDQGSTINLTCLVQFAPEPPPTVGWTHEKQVSGTIYVLFSTTLTKKNGLFRILFTK